MTAASTPSNDPPGYEQARAELEQVVQALEQGPATLEESLALWERGEELAALCTRWLEGAQARLEAARPDPEAARPDPEAAPDS